jgi:S-layer protein
MSKINGVTTFGLAGNDIITANGDALAAGSAAKLNAGAGNDKIRLSGATVLSSSVVYGGAGNDLVASDRDFYATNIRGGSGNDTISLSASFLSAATINGNDNADVISANIDAESNASLIAAGMGKDKLSAVFVSGSNKISINGGEGHDKISVVLSNAGGFSAGVVNGGAGFDSISFDALASNGLTGKYAIDGGALGDTISFAGEVASVNTAAINGGDGADTITFADNLSQKRGDVNGGLGNDSIYISAQFSAGSINGGAGADSITLKTFATGGGQGTIYGDAGADVFSLGSATFQGVSGQSNINTGGGASIGYNAFSESTLSTFDKVSAGLTITATNANVSGRYITSTLFDIRQDVLTASAATNISVANFTGTDGIATFTSTFTNNLTARVEELDRVLAVGQTIGFTDDNSKYYVFVQGGASGSGTGGDLLVNLNTAVGSVTVSANSAISVNTRQKGV